MSAFTDFLRITTSSDRGEGFCAGLDVLGVLGGPGQGAQYLFETIF